MSFGRFRHQATLIFSTSEVQLSVQDWNQAWLGGLSRRPDAEMT